MFRHVPQGPADLVYILKRRVDADASPKKVDLGVGVYRNEVGEYNELEAIKRAKKILDERKLGHDYESTTGNSEFVKKAAKLMFGKDAEAIQSGKISSVQAISGTGAIHLAALFLSRTPTFKQKKIYIGTPAWGNYEPLFSLVGLVVEKYKYYDGATGAIDFANIINAVKNADEGSVFVLQGCCHNPSGIDLTKPQWEELAHAMRERNGFPFFDMAYQGLGKSLDEDAYGLRLFADMGFELIAAQSFSKNFGLYGERVGMLHVLCETKGAAEKVWDQLRCLIRWEFSSSPAYGARLASIILGDETLEKIWTNELATIQQRLDGLRKALHTAIVKRCKTPGSWETILSSTGLFCFLPLSPQQCEALASKFHIYLLQNGRINVSGLNASNLDRVAAAIDEVARGVYSDSQP